MQRRIRSRRYASSSTSDVNNVNISSSSEINAFHVSTNVVNDFTKALQTFEQNVNNTQDLPVFRGLACEDLFDFLDAIEMYKMSTGLSDELLAKKASRLLKDIALTWFMHAATSDPELFKSWQKIREKLIENFAPNKTAYKLIIEEKLRNRKQGINESFRNFYFDVLKLCARIDAKMNEDAKISRLMQGMKTELYKNIATSLPSTCNELLQKAQNFEEIENVISIRNAFQSNNNESVSLMKPFVDASRFVLNSQKATEVFTIPMHPIEPSCSLSPHLSSQQKQPTDASRSNKSVKTNPGFMRNASSYRKPYFRNNYRSNFRNANPYSRYTRTLFCKAYVNGLPVLSVIDTGAGTTIINKDLFERLNVPLLPYYGRPLKLANGNVVFPDETQNIDSK
ncbi:hypothetical protein B4U80_14864 [Leptotrombidium deliense]|uniref:Retrotransposon gag domain-containing protein n=1 Tax=Leptotrombidium deliense TaxID=299467 RepID=A0A443SEK7_9ACAR|nr:hypothetical protein B4U80_14864 [Leptotrombidium deliense]